MLVSLMGSATISGGSTVTPVGLQGCTVTKTGTGLYTIALQDPYKALLSASITMQSALASDIQAQIVTADVSNAKTIVIRTVVAGVATDIPNGDAMLIRIDLRNSSQTP